MIYFCADDYGLSENSDSRIQKCLDEGALNKISVLPGGDVSNLKQRLAALDAELTLHTNLVEGYPLSHKSDVTLLVGDDGCFKYSFVGLLLVSLSPKRKKFKEQIYNEFKSQIAFWKKTVGGDIPISIDSHQHSHMIPFVFKTLLRVIEDEGVNVKYMRIPREPITPYIFTPSLYFEYSLTGLAKQWLLNLFALVNHKRFKKTNIQTAYFMGALFSGQLNEERIKKLLPKYIKLANKKEKNIELCFHPGYLEPHEKTMDGNRKGFEKFYYSPWRKTEYDTLLNYKL